jgi:hypothetical protein
LADVLQRSWTRLLKKAGLDKKSGKWHELHFHTLRKYFETQRINAGVRRPYIEFWLGHKGEYLDDSYFRANLQEHLTEYTKAIPYLSILETPKISEEERRKRTILDIASMLFRDQPEKYERIKNILAEARTMREIDDTLTRLKEERLKP